MRRFRGLIVSLLTAAIVPLWGSPAAADPCIYDSVGNRICVSENGVEVPEGTMWFCVIYTFSGGQICVSSDGQVSENP